MTAYLDAARDRAFAWGEWDCVRFAAGAVEVITGERPALPVYASALDAARLTRERSLRARVCDVLGPEFPPALAHRGDVVLWTQGEDYAETLGVCVGDLLACAGPDGLAMAPMTAAVAAWRI